MQATGSPPPIAFRPRGAWWSRLGKIRLVLLAVALLAYTPAFWWGAPYASGPDRTNAWGVDDEPPLGPLAQAHDILHPKAEQNPNLGYPMLHPFLVLGSFTPYMGYLFASGQVQSPTIAYPHGFRDPVAALRDLTFIAHFLSVLLAVGVVLCAYETGRVLWDERTGVASAVAVLLMYPMFYYARNSNVDVPVLFFTAAALWAFSVIVRHGLTMRRSLAFGTAVGLAVATKEPAFASFVFAPAVLLLLPNPGDQSLPVRSPAFWRVAIVGALASLLTYALASGLVIDHRRWIAHIEFIRSRLTDLEANGIAFVTTYPRTWQGDRDFIWRLVSLLADTLTWPGLVFAIGSVAAVARRGGRDALLALSAIGYLTVLFLSARTAQLRYVLPAALVLAIYAGRGVMLAWASRSRLRIPVLALGATAATILTLWAIDLTAAMLRDSRYAAARWIAAEARAGDALEYFGSEHKNPPLPATLALAPGNSVPGEHVPGRYHRRCGADDRGELARTATALRPDHPRLYQPREAVHRVVSAGDLSRPRGWQPGLPSRRALRVSGTAPVHPAPGARLSRGESANPHLRADCSGGRERRMTPEARQRLWSIVRVVIAITLISVLAGSGVIQWPKLRGLLVAWPLTLAALGLLFTGMVLASWRFCLLTEAQRLHVSLGNSVRLTLIGNAANLVLPTVGSDLIRLWFAADGHAGRRTEIATIVLLDRVLGLVGILLLPIVLAPFFAAVVADSPVILWILAVSAAGAVALLAGILVALSRRGLASAPVQLALRLFPLRGYPRRILDTIHSYRHSGGTLAMAVGWSVAANLCAAACIVCLQLATHPGSAAALGAFLTSLAFVLNNVPITPGGIGFTEAAVASLYRIAGLEGGAETMLGMRLLFLLLAPVGVYLYFRGVRSILTPTGERTTSTGHA